MRLTIWKTSCSLWAKSRCWTRAAAVCPAWKTWRARPGEGFRAYPTVEAVHYIMRTAYSGLVAKHFQRWFKAAVGRRRQSGQRTCRSGSNLCECGPTQPSAQRLHGLARHFNQPPAQ
eukprot:363611-Chlamydomonas_euryale.AAC.9